MTKKENSPVNPGQRPLWKRRSVKIVAALLVSIAVVAVSLPIGAGLYLQKWLVDNGADSATVGKVRFNPFSGTATLQGVDIEKNGQTVFSDATIYLNVGLKNLLGREANLQRATIADLEIDIEQYKDGTLRIASYSIPPGQDDQPDTAVEVEKRLEQQVPWIFAADQIRLQNVTVHYKQPDLRAELVVEEALLDKFSTDPDGPSGVFTFKGTLNGAPIRLNLSTFNLIPWVEIKGTADIADVKLDDLADFLGEYLHPFSGTAGIQGEVGFSMTDSEDLIVDYDGLISLENGNVGGDGWKTKGDIGWEGKVSFTMAKEEMIVDVDGQLQALNAAFNMPDPVINIDNSDINISGKTTVTIGDEVVVDTGASLKLAPTAFSMDILKTAAGDTSWDGKVHVETGTDTKGLVVRTDGKIQLADPAYSMDVDGALMEVSNQMLSFDGRFEYSMGVGSDSADFVRTDGVLLGDTTLFSLPEVVHVSQSRLDLKGKTEIEIGQDLIVTYQGDTLLDKTGVEITGVKFGDKQVSWSGQVKYQLGEKSQQITLDGDLKAEGILVDMEEGNLQVEQKNLQSRADFSLLLKDTPSFKGEVSLAAKGLGLKRQDTPLLTLAGISIDKLKDNGSGGVKVGSLLFSKLDILSSSDIPVNVTIPSITATNIVSPDFKSGAVGRLSIDKPTVLDGEKKSRLAQVDAITAEKIQLNEDISVAVDKVIIDKGSFLQNKGQDPLATLGQLTAGQIHYSLEQGVSLDTVDIDSVFADYKLQKSAEQPVNKDKDKDKGGGPAEPAKNGGLPVKINQINIVGSSGLKFTDETLSKPFETTLHIKSLQIRDIDLNDPDHPFSYSLKGKFDRYAPLKIKGSAAPLAAQLFIEQQTTLQNYSMTRISPYAIETIGTFFPSGRLDLTASLKIGDGKIDMKNDIVLKDLKAETYNGDLADKLNNQLPVPLDLALSMLKDRDGDIELKIPLSGELDSLNVGVADIVITALSKGITVAVAPYLAYTFLGPAGALAFVGAEMGASLLHTDLPSLEFDPGVIDISEAQTKILDKVGKAIEKDKEKSYSICAKVGVDEAGGSSSKEKGVPKVQSEAVRKTLFKLGDGRSQAVKKYLLSHFKIDEERLLICNPGINFKKGDKPVIEFRK